VEKKTNSVGIDMIYHYYTPQKRKSASYMLISDFIRGVTVEFEVIPGLFSYKEVDEGTKLLLEYAEIPSEGLALDLGCGYGVIGIVLAKLNPKLKIYMVDINEDAVRVAKRNIKRNEIDETRVIVLQGDLYEPVKNIVFKAIYSNPPLSAGFETVEKIIIEAPQHLENGGILQIVVRKGVEKVYGLMKKTFDNVEILSTYKGYKVLLSRK
jgi:16S rRNA G1207 methylase RsmC